MALSLIGYNETKEPINELKYYIWKTLYIYHIPFVIYFSILLVGK